GMLLLVVAAVLIALQPPDRTVAFYGSFVVDTYARFLKILALAGSAIVIVMSGEFLGRPDRQRFEYPVLILLSTTGMMMLISAADLIALYLGFELMSLALYVIAGIDRGDTRATDEGLNNFGLRPRSSGLLPHR